MSDISTIWEVSNCVAGWQINGAQLQTGNDLETAVLISLFTDRQAQPDDVIPDGTGDPRGWWGDVPGEPQIGSRLWLLSRSKLTTQVALKAKDFCTEALQWLIDDGVASAIAVVTEIVHPSRLYVQVTITKNNVSQTLRFGWAWDQISNPQTQAIRAGVNALATETGALLTTENGTLITI
ncbi:MAG TPA: phage GP46 family protein [Rhizomicrobium sp.]|jgi:phage gp46-like protein